jgi:signal transduction histidine kinase
MRYLLIILAACLPLLAQAIEFDEHVQCLALGRSVQVFEDVEGKATIESVSAAANRDAFRPLEAETFNAGYSRSVFWLKGDLSYRPAESAGPVEWLLELAYPPLDRVELYLPDASGQLHLVRQTGDTLPFSSRQIKQATYLFDLDLLPHKPVTFYVRISSEGSVQAPLKLWSSKAFIEQQPAQLQIMGLIYGVLLGMLIYNLFIYISVRDTSHLYLILYIATFGLYQLSISGTAIEYFWPDNPWWANASTPFLMGIAVLFNSLFARRFLQTAQLARWLDHLLWVLMTCAAGVMLTALVLSYDLALRAATVLVIGCTWLMLLCGITAVVKGVRSARYYLAGWAVFSVGATINALMLLGYLPNTFFTLYIGQMGAVLEIAFLSLALADRLNQVREQQARTLLEAGKDLERLNQQLAASNRYKDEFLATLTHELRTPMNGVIGSLELMKTVEMDGEMKLYQQTAASSAQDMMRMINGILTLSELQAGALYAECEVFDPAAVLDRLRERFSEAARLKGLALNLILDEGLPLKLRGDAAKLYQCVECLADNAIKFTCKGAVTLRAGGVLYNIDRFELRVEVVDTGIGFSHLDEARLYQHFFQIDSSMTREHGGLGIGLAICRKLAELQGGTLDHESEPGIGSRFVVSLPLWVAMPGTPGGTSETAYRGEVHNRD